MGRKERSKKDRGRKERLKRRKGRGGRETWPPIEISGYATV